MNDALLLVSIGWTLNVLWCAANVYGSIQARRQWYLADRLMRHANSAEYRRLRAEHEAAYVRETIKEWEEEA